MFAFLIACYASFAHESKRNDARGSIKLKPWENGSTLTHQSDNVDKPLLATQKEKKDYERKKKVATLADRGNGDDGGYS